MLHLWPKDSVVDGNALAGPWRAVLIEVGIIEVGIGLGAALGALPFASGGEGRRRVVRSWTAGSARAAG